MFVTADSKGVRSWNSVTADSAELSGLADDFHKLVYHTEYRLSIRYWNGVGLDLSS